jgi:hypothetical protein
MVRLNRCDEYAIGLSVGADQKFVAATIDEANFFVEGDGARISFPHAEPQIPAVENTRCCMNGQHESLGNALSMNRAIDIEAVQLDRSIDADSGRWIFALDLGEGDQRCALMRKKGHHARAQQLPGLLFDSEGFYQMGVQIFGSIMGPKGFFEGARSERGELRGVGFDAGANLNGVGIEHELRIQRRGGGARHRRPSTELSSSA